MAEISIGAGIQPIRDTINGKAVICQGVFSTKSAPYSGCSMIATMTARTVARVKADIIHLASPSRNL